MRCWMTMAAVLACWSGAALAADDPGPRIIVSGSATVMTPPDLATIEFRIVGEGATSDAAVAAMVAKRARIAGALAALDAHLQPQAGEVAVDEVRGADCPRRYDQPRLSTGACAVTGYLASVRMTLRTAGVKDAGTAAGLIGRDGGSETRLSGYGLADPAAALRRATAAALLDARAQAAAIARNSGVTLGRLLLVSTTNYGGGADDIIVDELHNRVAPAAPPAPPPVPVDLTPRPIETRAQVTVSYAIGS